jgi:hypothetical protein
VAAAGLGTRPRGARRREGGSAKSLLGGGRARARATGQRAARLAVPLRAHAGGQRVAHPAARLGQGAARAGSARARAARRAPIESESRAVELVPRYEILTYDCVLTNCGTN